MLQHLAYNLSTMVRLRSSRQGCEKAMRLAKEGVKLSIRSTLSVGPLSSLETPFALTSKSPVWGNMCSRHDEHLPDVLRSLKVAVACRDAAERQNVRSLNSYTITSIESLNKDTVINSQTHPNPVSILAAPLNTEAL